MRCNICTLGVIATLSCLPRAASAADTPAAEIATKMAGVVDDLNRKETGEPVQTEQKAIIHDLDELIASLEKQREALRGGLKRNRPTRGMDDSMISSGTGGSGPLGNPDEHAKDWGKLSGRERDRILQSMSEGFPPEYRTVLERYYRRLAEEKKAAPSAAGRAQAKESEDKPAPDAKP